MRSICLSLLIVLWAVPAAMAEGLTLSPQDQKALRELERQVTTLKESVHQSKVRVRELEEAVLRGKITGSKAFITFTNEAEGFFAFTGAEFYLNNKLIKKIEGKGTKKPVKKVQVYDSDLPAGDHTLKVRLQYAGSDKSIYQMFPYFKDHKFTIDTTEKFTVEYGKTTLVKLVTMDKGYFKKDIRERLFMEVQTFTDWGTDTTE